MTGEPLPVTAADVAALRALLDEMKKTKDADDARIAKLEKRVDEAEEKLEAAKRNVKSATLLDLF
jgi:predicted  nucleic acid-binding Zn-ribbon protein